MRRIFRISARLLLTLSISMVALAAASARAEDKPSVIRIAYPGVGIGNRPFVGGNSTAVMHLRGLLEEEFKADGIKVTWSFLRGAGPAVNELYANKLADFSLLGDLPSIIGHAGGLKTKVLAATGIRGVSYIAVPADSKIATLQDLKGKRVAIFKGTNIQLAAGKILESAGLSEKDLKVVNMDSNTSRAALITGDLDAAFGGPELLALRDQQTARIIYTTASEPTKLRHASFVGSEEFIKKYPSITKRVVKVLVQAAKWVSEQEGTPTPVYQLWAKSGTPYSNFKEDVGARSLRALSSPLLDPYFTSQYAKNIEEAKRFGLIRNAFKLEEWLEPRFLNEVLKEQGLESYWKPVDPSGQTQLAAK